MVLADGAATRSGPYKAVTPLWSAEESFMVGFICVQYTAVALEEKRNGTGSSPHETFWLWEY